jgi:transglutaminase/protease-like cytokinesis protein 3
MKKIIFVFFLAFSFVVQAQRSDFSHISFHRADSIAHSYLGADLNSVPKLSFLLTKDLDTEVEKVRSIFKWIASNITNDHATYLKNKRKRKQFQNDSIKLEEWNHEVRKKTLSTLLRKKKTVCTGYAFLFKQMLKYVDIESEIINGFSKTGGTEIEDLELPNHSWNAVKLNNKWYLCDPTWASGIYNPNTKLFEFDYKKGYFLTDPKLFITNHYPQNPEWTLISENNPTLEEYIDAPLLYTDAYKYSLLYQTPNKMYNTVKKKENISFQFDLLDSTQVNNVFIIISGKRKEETILPDNLEIDTHHIQFDYAFPFRGYYDLHLLLDGEAVMTYSFHVTRR